MIDTVIGSLKWLFVFGIFLLVLRLTRADLTGFRIRFFLKPENDSRWEEGFIISQVRHNKEQWEFVQEHYGLCEEYLFCISLSIKMVCYVHKKDSDLD